VGRIARFFGFGRNDSITEAAADAPATPPTAARSGYEFGIPFGGTTEYNQGDGGNQVDDLTELYQAAVACPWAGASVNAIARTITAGGAQIVWVPDADVDGEEEAPPRPPEVIRCQKLLKFCNQRETFVQICRGMVADLATFGDSYVEVAWFLGEPIALWSLDAPSMRIIADEHGEVSGYVQITEQGQRAEFEPHEVIHVSMDSPRSGLTGLSLVEQALLPITTWLFAKALEKERWRQGDPATLHVDFPSGMSDGEQKRWTAMFRQRNRGPKNVGTPITTRAGAKVQELQKMSTKDLLEALRGSRDEIIAAMGVPPAKVGIVESGNIGGGTGESQDKTFQLTTCQPIAELVLAALNFAILQQGFGITDWVIKFGAVDWRDSKTVEEIYDKRVRNGLWSLNRGRAEIGEPPVDGGDDPVVVMSEHVVAWHDMERYSQTTIARAAAPAVASGIAVPGVALRPPPTPPGPGASRAETEAYRAERRARLREALTAMGAAS